MKNSLISRLKNGFYTGLAAGALFGSLYGCGDGPTPPSTPKISQTATLENFVDINYRATFENTGSATRKTFHNGNGMTTETITTSPYTQVLTNRPKGEHMYVLEANGAKPDTARVNVPDYESVAPNLSGVNLDVNERDSIVVHLPRPSEKNPEDNPVRYTGVASTYSGVNASLGAFQNDSVLTVRASEIPGPDSVPYTLKLTRQGSTQEINLAGRVLDVPVAPAPDQIAFMRFVELDSVTGSQDIYSMNIDGIGLKRLTCSTNTGQSIPECATTIKGQNLEPTYSPDGSQIVFTSNRDLIDMALWVMNFDGSNPKKLTPNGLYASGSTWCNNGKIYFNFWNQSLNTQGIARINSDGNHLEKIIEEPFHNWLSGRPACSPDGSQIAFVTDKDGNAEIYTADSIGSVGSRRNITSNSAADALPAWSPDGRLIAFISDRNGGLKIYFKNLENGIVEQITHSQDYDPAWSPDGSYIVFTSERDGGYHLYKKNINTGEVNRLTFQSANRYPALRPRQ